MRFLIVPLASSAFVSEAARGAIDGGATQVYLRDVEGVVAAEFDLRRVGVLANRAHVLVGTHATLVHLLRVHTILRVQVLHLTGREHAVDAAVELHLGAEIVQKREALLLARELQEVRALAHDRRTTSRHFKDLFFLGFPRDDVELFNLNKTKQQQQEKVVEKKGQLKFFVVFVVVVVLDTHTTKREKKKILDFERPNIYTKWRRERSAERPSAHRFPPLYAHLRTDFRRKDAIFICTKS